MTTNSLVIFYRIKLGKTKRLKRDRCAIMNDATGDPRGKSVSLLLCHPRHHHRARVRDVLLTFLEGFPLTDTLQCTA